MKLNTYHAWNRLLGRGQEKRGKAAIKDENRGIMLEKKVFFIRPILLHFHTKRIDALSFLLGKKRIGGGGRGGIGGKRQKMEDISQVREREWREHKRWVGVGGDCDSARTAMLKLSRDSSHSYPPSYSIVQPLYLE